MSEQANQRSAASPEGRSFPWRRPECGKKEVRLATVSHTSQIKHDGRLYIGEDEGERPHGRKYLLCRR
jgi:hypothetical protein